MKTKLTLLGAIMIVSFGFTRAQMARVQAIHNCADAAASVVDVYIGSTLLLDDFAFQDASPYIDAPAGTSFTLSICPSNSVDTTSAIFKKNFTLMNNETYTVVASGGLSQTGSTAFDLRAYSGDESGSQGNLDVNFIHGSYDAPEVDVYEIQTSSGFFFTNFAFGDELGYNTFDADDYDFQVRTQTGEVVAQYDVDLSAFPDSAITVLATGYLDPSSNPGTEPFGLMAVFPNGTVVQLPTMSVTPARLQVIHNCAATDAASVDVWLNNSKLLANFDFRTASPFIDAPAGEFFDVRIQGPMSSDTNNPIFKQTFILESGKTYIVVASGTVGSGIYTPATPFSLEVITEARETATTAGNVDVLVWHGATDAPTVDVVETAQGAGTIVDDLSYGESQGYLDLPATNYALEIRDETGSTVVAKYVADVTGLADSAITILASGFLSPDDNNNGEAFGLWVALPGGGDLLELGVITGLSEVKKDILNLNLYPNPAQDVVNLTLTSETIGVQNVLIMDARGLVVASEQISVTKGSNRIELNVSSLSAGNYYVLVGNNELSSTIQMIKQ